MKATLDLNLIAAFVRVVEAGSFTEAARGLGLPKSSVSRRVTALEKALGVRLLQRSTRKLVLTEGGRVYFERARAGLSGLTEASDAVADMGHDVAGLVRFSAASDGTGWLTGIVAEFLRRYPKVQLDVILTPRRVDLLAEGVDIALRAGRLADSSLVARRLGSSDLGLFASRGYLRRAGTPKRVSDLAKHDFVLYGLAADRNTVRLNGPRGLETVKVQGPLSVNEMSFAGEAVARGVGIGLIPVLFFRPGATPRRHVVRVLPEYAVTGVDVNLVSPPTAYEPARVALFRDFLAEQLGPRVKACEAAQHEETARALGRAADGRRAPSRPAR